jgi:DNA-binding transcriptional MocR family regulator
VATGAASGTHVFLRFPLLRATTSDRLLAAARAKGVHVYSAMPYYIRAPRDVRLILGYTTVALDEIEHGIARLAAAYATVLSRS